jgi:hypothetical protein
MILRCEASLYPLIARSRKQPYHSCSITRVHASSEQLCQDFQVARRSTLSGCTSTDRYEIASVDLDECIERLKRRELLAESVIEAICAKTKELLMKESNVVHIKAPVTVVGDIHGQFFDMMEIFEIGGNVPDTNYLFLGEWQSSTLRTSAKSSTLWLFLSRAARQLPTSK